MELKEATEEKEVASEVNVEDSEASAELKEVSEVEEKEEEKEGEKEDKEVQDIEIVKKTIFQEVTEKTEKVTEMNETLTELEVLALVETMKELANDSIGNLESTKMKVKAKKKTTITITIVDLSEELEVVDTGMKDKMIDLPEVTMEMFTNLPENEKLITITIARAEEEIVKEVPCEAVLLEDTVTMILIKGLVKATLLLAN